MLEKAIEIEGLLRIIRDGQPLPETYQLLNDKAGRLSEQAAALLADSATPQPQPSRDSSDFVMASACVETPKPKVDFSDPEPTPKEEPMSQSPEVSVSIAGSIGEMGEDDIDLTEEDDILLSFDDGSDSAQAASRASLSATDSESDLPETPEEESLHSGEKTSFIEDQEPEKEGEADKDEASGGQSETKTPAPARRQLKLKSVFSLNDRFLYSRELFEGNMKMFDSTLEFIEGIEDYSIIEDYFYSELDWDPENRDVAAFMEILRPHFKD